MSVLVIAIVLGIVILASKACLRKIEAPEETGEAGLPVVEPPVFVAEPLLVETKPVPYKPEPPEFVAFPGPDFPISEVSPAPKLPAGGFASESHIQNAITAGTIPPPPQDVQMIPENAWYWDGHWTTRMRPGFEPVRIVISVTPPEMIARPGGPGGEVTGGYAPFPG